MRGPFVLMMLVSIFLDGAGAALAATPSVLVGGELYPDDLGLELHGGVSVKGGLNCFQDPESVRDHK
jgi:preprotein translocase subunit SecD